MMGFAFLRVKLGSECVTPSESQPKHDRNSTSLILRGWGSLSPTGARRGRSRTAKCH